jgi:hypothetical protein
LSIVLRRSNNFILKNHHNGANFFVKKLTGSTPSSAHCHTQRLRVTNISPQGRLLSAYIDMSYSESPIVYSYFPQSRLVPAHLRRGSENGWCISLLRSPNGPVPNGPSLHPQHPGNYDLYRGVGTGRRQREFVAGESVLLRKEEIKLILLLASIYVELNTLLTTMQFMIQLN